MLTYLDNRVECVPTSEWSLDTLAYESALASYHADMRAMIDRMK
jgi:hypothetical protein